MKSTYLNDSDESLFCECHLVDHMLLRQLAAECRDIGQDFSFFKEKAQSILRVGLGCGSCLETNQELKEIFNTSK